MERGTRPETPEDLMSKREKHRLKSVNTNLYTEDCSWILAISMNGQGLEHLVYTRLVYHGQDPGIRRV